MRFALVLALVPAILIAVYRFVPVPATPLMVLRAFEGHGVRKDWEPIENISPHLVRAVVAAEDMRFCDHWGFDWGEIKDAAARNRKGQRVRGASTITMQTAKNLFLWPARSWLRKGFEAYLTVWIEVLWPKARVIEVYLNIVEWGPGIYGAEAAARYWFDISARSLSPHQAALLAASLPSPLYSTPAWPSDYLWSRAATILSRMGDTHLDRVTVCP